MRRWEPRTMAAIALLGTLAGASFAQQGNQVGVPAFYGVKITEVCYGDPECVELTNFGGAAVNLNGWTLQWWDDAMPAVAICFLGNVNIGCGESIVVHDSTDPVPPADTVITLQVLACLPMLNTSTEGLEVALVDAGGAPIDRVRIGSTGNTAPVHALPGVFRNFVRRGAYPAAGAVGVERIWGLDSDGPTDWTEQPDRSMGLENRSSGLRTLVDPAGIPGTFTAEQALLGKIVLNEIDHFPGYVEIYNANAAGVNLAGCHLLASSRSGLNHALIPLSLVIPAGGYLVLGNGATTPAEMPAGTPYLDVTTVGPALPFTREEFSCVLYDPLGRVLDAVRTTGWDLSLGGSSITCPQGASQVPGIAHNHPRAPTHWADFTGVAGRTCESAAPTGEQNAIGRVRGAGGAPLDTNRGTDWRSVYLRTMGLANDDFAAGVGHGDLLDVRCNARWTGTGLTVIVNAGPASAGRTCSIFASATPAHGFGPFLGLASDALFIWLNVIRPSPVFTQTLDAQGSMRFDFDPLPPFYLDLVFFLSSADFSNFYARTWASEYFPGGLCPPF